MILPATPTPIPTLAPVDSPEFDELVPVELDVGMACPVDAVEEEAVEESDEEVVDEVDEQPADEGIVTPLELQIAFATSIVSKRHGK
jgi:hypothetical protein